MIYTTAPYRAEMARTLRDRTYMRIRLGVVDLTAYEDAVLSSTDQLWYSSLGGIVYDSGVPAASYATFERGRMVLGSQQVIASQPSPLYQGYVSNTVADENGDFSTPPAIDIRFSYTHDCPALSFVFDATTGDYPVELTVDVYTGTVLTHSYTVEPDNAAYVYTGSFADFDRLVITFTKAQPYRRARLQQIIFGTGIIFENDTLLEATKATDIDPISRRLAEETLEFAISNVDGMYDPDNPRGIWEVLESPYPITIEFGQRIREGITWADAYMNTWEDLYAYTWQELYEGGMVVWLNGGRYVLNGQPEVSGIRATFSARSRLNALVNSYHSGQYVAAGKTLYELAQAVCEDADIPDIADGVPGYYLDVGLRSISTVAPLPKDSHRNLLQLIAHAAGMVCYTDRDGIVRLEPIDDTQQDYDMDFATIIGRWPDVTKTPPLAAVRVLVYSYKRASETQELHRETYSPGAYLVEFDWADSITITGATATQITSGSVAFTVTTAGEVVIMGYPIETSTSSVTASTGLEGETETVDNPLVTDRTAAQALAQHIRDYLQHRITYEFDYRGDPAVECMDIVNGESRYDSEFPMRVLTHELRFNGALTGHITGKKLEPEEVRNV